MPRKPLLNKSDFEQIGHFILVTNTSADQIVRDIDSITITQFLPNGFEITLPTGTCATGHTLLLSIYSTKLLHLFRNAPNQVTADQSNEEFRTTAKVIEIHDSSPGICLVTLEFRQFVEIDWKKFQNKYTGRQEELNKIIERIKG